MPVTSADVARYAKVSQSAVSRTFTPGASVSPQMREKILKAAAELGYRPNALARAMISRRSGLIAVLVAYLDNQFYPLVIEELSRQLQMSGYRVLLFLTEPGNQDEVVNSILQYQVEGIVMATATLSSNLAIDCARTGIPVVMFNRYVSSSPTSSVTSDNVEGGRLAADFLVRGGHARIAFIAGAEDSSTNRDREAGFHKGLAEHGRIAFARGIGGYSFERAACATRLMFERENRPDALFVANDHMALSVIDVLKTEYGLRVPEDVSVIGFDDVPQAAWKGYDLTTIAQSRPEMVKVTANILLEQIERGSVESHAEVLPVRLVVRGSARLPLA